MASSIGVDLGGTKIAIARYDSSSWSVQERDQMSTHADQDFDHVFEDLLEMIEKIKTNDTGAIGIGVPGLVRQPEGEIVTLPNIPGAEGRNLKN